MALSTYLLYVVAVALLIVTPGPTMLMCMTNSINHGPRRAMTSVAGSVTAVLGVMLLSAMGLGALLAASETAFTTAKVIGAAYLIWLGIRTFRSNTVLRADNPAAGTGAPVLLSAGTDGRREQPEIRAVLRRLLSAVPGAGRADRTAVRDAGARPSSSWNSSCSRPARWAWRA